MIPQLNTRKAQFFIITAVLIGSSLSITANILSDYQQIPYDQITSSSTPSSFRSITNNLGNTWYTTNWQYRRNIQITENSDRDVTDFPVSIQIDTQKLISQGKMQSNCGDLRIVENTVERPHQIETGECNTTNTTIWFLTNLSSGATENDAYLLYGTNQTVTNNYTTSLEWKPGDNTIQNSLLELTSGTVGGERGFTKVRRKGGDNLAGDNLLLFHGPSGATTFQIEQQGPVFITASFNATHNYTLFNKNSFLRWNGKKDIQPGTTFWYGQDNTVLTHWQAGNQFSRDEIENTDTFSGNFDPDDPKYISALNDSTGASLTLTTNNNALNHTIGQYNANGGTSSGQDDRMGISNSSTSLTFPYIDYWVGDNYIPTATMDILSHPPTASVSSSEQSGIFTPSRWEHRALLSIQENNGSFLSNYPVNISINTAEMNVHKDCRDLVFIENSIARPYKLYGTCDSRTFRQPSDYTARWPMDHGIGVFANDTSPNNLHGTLNGDTAWAPGRFNSALDFDGNSDYVEIPNDQALNPDTFTITSWVKWRGESGTSDTSNENIISKAKGSDQGYALSIKHNLSAFQFIIGNGTTYNHAESTTAPDTDSWVFLAGTYDGEDISIYVNGELEDTVSSDAYDKDSSELTLGAHPNAKTNSDFNFNGTIDETKLYSRVLTDDEIHDQFTEKTTIAILTNLSALAEETDVRVFGGGGTDIQEPATTPTDFIPASGTDQPTASVQSVNTYHDIAQHFINHVEETDTLAELDFVLKDKCTTVILSTRQFNLDKTVC